MSGLACTVPPMSERPTTSWHHATPKEAKELAAGTADTERACTAGLAPEEPLTATGAFQFHDASAIETDEHGEPCAHIDQSLAEHNVDVIALTTPQGQGRYQLTYKRRRW